MPYVCPDEQISVIAKLLHSRGYGDSPESVAISLHAENVESVNFTSSEIKQYPFEFKDVDLSQYSVGKLIKAIDNYRYQTFDHPGWKGSSLDDATRNLMISMAIPYMHDTESLLAFIRPQMSRVDGWDEASWSWSPNTTIESPTIQRRSRGRSKD